MYLPLRTLAATTKALLEMLSLKLINLDRIYIQKKKTNHVNSLYRIPVGFVSVSEQEMAERRAFFLYRTWLLVSEVQLVLH